MRLDVAVDDAGRVGGVERFGDLGQQVHRALGLERALAVDQLAQVAALDQAHRHDQLAVVLAGVVDRHHGGVLESRGETRLAEEAAAELLVVGELAGDHLERHRPLQGQLGRPVDDPHAAAGDQRVEPVAAKRRADRGFSHTAVI